jgi:hypothetical protein
MGEEREKKRREKRSEKKINEGRGWGGEGREHT